MNQHKLSLNNFLKGVWKDNMPKEWYKKLEDLCAKDAQYAHHYAKHVIKGRFPKGEEAIAKDPEFSYRYARFVINERFPEGEKVVRRFANYKRDYEKYFGIKL